jgi:tripartite-type tricarboxylate transporter receptor subunit TctC
MAAFAAAIVVAPLIGVGSATAQSAVKSDYPNRIIKIVVGFPPGGGVDTVARVIGQEMAKGLGQAVIIENKPGASGTIGAAAVARAEPDGYTLMMAPGGHALYGATFNALPFDTVESFTWISNVMTLPFIIVVPPASKYRTLAELIDAAKAAPETVSFGSAGPGSTHHLVSELLGRSTGVKFLHVPYRGDASAVTAALGGEVQFTFATPTLVVGNVEAGKLRALATTANARFAGLPQVPTLEQALDIAAFDVGTWFGLAGPAGMSRSIVARLNAQVREALADPQVRARLQDIGGEIQATTPEEMHDRVARELRVWTRTVEEAGIPKQ